MADRPAFISGLRNSTEFGTGERPKNFREAIMWLDPNGMAPLQAISAKMKSENVDDAEFNWWEEVMDVPKAIVVTTGTGTSLTLNSTQSTYNAAGLNYIDAATVARMFKPGDILQLYQPTVGQPDYLTGVELMRVETIASATSITVTRNINNIAGALTLVAGDQLRLVGSVYAEGSTSPDSRTSQPQLNTNYTQIFKTPFQVTGTAMATNYRTGSAFENDRKRAMFNHSTSLEQSMLWGFPRVDFALSGEIARLTGGLRYFLQSNVNVNVGSVTEDFFFDSLQALFNYNAGGAGDQRIVMLGNGALNAFQKAIKDSTGFRMNYNGTVRAWNMKLLEFTTPQGSLYMKTHPLLNTDPVYTNSMFVLNGKGIIRRPLKGRDTKIQQNIQANDADLRKDQWITEIGWEIQFERTMGYFGGITY
jgi:hypothetical protein